MMDTPTAPMPRLVIAAPQGRSGKTTLTLGLCAALTQRGLRVQPFKKGPDYIDPSWLSEAAGHPCRTLDPFFLPEPGALECAFWRGAAQADLSIIEGNHGLYDSLDIEGSGSTAAVARALGAPVLLVVNAARMSRSAAAMVCGYQTFEPDTNIAGVVLNNVASSPGRSGRHEGKLRQAIERYCRIPVVGALPCDQSMAIPDRHLGLVPRPEDARLVPAIQACRHAVETGVDLDAVLKIARSAPPLASHPSHLIPHSSPLDPQPSIGIICDRAFTFYYPENMEALKDAGARLVFINALSEPALPRLDALYIGGGFPEIFMDELSANMGMRQSIRQAVENGLPVYAECGGMMYLSRRILWGERSAEMVGALPCEIEMTGRPQGHGYVVAQVEEENPFFAPGSTLRGHEFHNSRLVFAWTDDSEQPPLKTVYKLTRGNGLGDGRDGIVVRNVLASYTHLHVGGLEGWAESLVNCAQLYRESHWPEGSLA